MFMFYTAVVGLAQWIYGVDVLLCILFVTYFPMGFCEPISKPLKFLQNDLNGCVIYKWAITYLSIPY